MKFGLIQYMRNTRMNIGDTIQSIGILNIFKEFGVKSEDIVPLNYRYLADYDGEYVVTPMCACFDYWYDSKIFPLSPKILPVFFGFRCIDEGHFRYLTPWKHTALFGCRDEETMRLLRKNGFRAFISGCASMLSVSRRSDAISADKVFLVDIPETLYPYIPADLLQDSETLTHLYDFPTYALSRAAHKEKELAFHTLQRYQTEAKLVITSRLHAALPCVAMGIPVILVRNALAMDHRYSGLHTLFPVYSSDEFSKIDWNPPIPDIRILQKTQMNLACQMLHETFEKYRFLCDISSIFEKRSPKIYFSGVSMGYLTRNEQEIFLQGRSLEKNLFAYILKRKLPETHLIIYGAGDKGKWLHHRYREEIALCRSCIYVDNDNAKQGTFLNGYKILSPSVIAKYPRNKLIILIASSHSYDASSRSIALELCNIYDFEEGKEFFMLDKLNASAQYALSDFGSIKTWAEEHIWY